MKAAIIDDCQRDRETLENYLTQYFSEHDFNITLKLEHYTSCKEFLNDFCNQKYEIIFIDYYMTDSNGLDLAKQIKRISTLNFVLSNGDSIPFRKKEYHKVVSIYSNFLLEEANLFDT